MGLLGLKLFNLASYMYLLVTSLFLAGDFYNPNDMVLVMPAPFAFSIWGLIYLLLFLYIMKSFFADESLNEQIQKIGFWFPITMILSGTSVILGTTPSILFLSLSLVTLCVVYTNQQMTAPTVWQRIPFSLYLGWTSIATIVDAFVVLKANGITELFGIGELGWSVIMLTLGGLIAIAFSFAQNDAVYPLVFVWGYGAIFAYQTNELIRFITAGFVIILLFVTFFRLFKSNIVRKKAA
ncbi:tryptophan-rich sensory protein [Halobacillus litoralis]|uniref:tryptophan-rich sensory protein n=1 Tax=Halobacillus litoralis TaxID=45668 RepID=UPI001CD21EF0|nr:tryptophan-rich sensory protein [Halobacillus litoralis]MCA0971984.1 tryptophan-rich sensory protein [Halobacillus litoralis]